MTEFSISASYNLPTLSEGSGAYISAVRSIPKLSEEEERRLTNRLYYDNDTDAARILAVSNLSLVVQVAQKYSGYGLSQIDLIQEGNVGLLKAIKKFSPNRGARLATFAVYWIRAEIHEFIIRNWRIVKIATTKAQRKLFFNMRKLKKWDGNREDENRAVAKELKVKPEEVEDMRTRIFATDTVLLSSESDDERSNGTETYLADSSEYSNPEKIAERHCEHQAIGQALDSITDRERDIIYKRRLQDPPQTLQEVAGEYDLSIERVRQIENVAMKKIAISLKNHLNANVVN